MRFWYSASVDYQRDGEQHREEVLMHSAREWPLDELRPGLIGAVESRVYVHSPISGSVITRLELVSPPGSPQDRLLAMDIDKLLAA